MKRPRTGTKRTQPRGNAQGYFLTGVLDWMRRGNPRPQTPAALASLLTEPLPDDLRAFLQALAGYQQTHFSLGDYWLSETTLAIRDPKLLQGHVCIGETPTGDVWLASRGGTQPPQIFLSLQDGDGKLERVECEPGLDPFFAWLCWREQAEYGEGTDLDDYFRHHRPPRGLGFR